MYPKWMCLNCGSVSDICIRQNGEKATLLSVVSAMHLGDKEDVFLYCETCGESVGFVQVVRDDHGGAFVYEGNVVFFYEEGEQHGEESGQISMEET